MQTSADAIYDDFSRLRNLTCGDPEIVVAILDGPVDLKHPCLINADIDILDFGEHSAAPDARISRHGTHVTSQIFAAGDCGMMGIAPDCRGLILPVYGSDKDGRLLAASQIDLACAIHRAIDHGAHIINISGGELSASDEADQFLANALELCAQSGVLVVAAAGNDGCECLHVPAAVGSVIAVGACDSASGEPTAFSNWGAAYRANGILARGTAMPGADSRGGIALQTGTSFAAPIIAGAAALLMSLQLRRRGVIDAPAVRAALLRGARRCNDSDGTDCRRFLAGTLDVDRSLELLFPQSAALPKSPIQASLEGAHFAIGPPLGSGVRPAAQGSPIDAQRNQEGNNMSNESNAAGPAIEPGNAPEPVAAGIEPSGQAAAPPAPPVSAGVTPSGGCGCDGGGGGDPGGCGCASCAGEKSHALVFALGELGYDLGTEARKDSLWQAIGDDPFEWGNLVKHLEKNPWDAEAVTWTLRIDATPIYAIRPTGAFAADAYRRLADYLIGQIGGSGKDKRKIDRISLPGTISGAVTLSNGVVVPVVEPALRGMFAWDTRSLVQSLATKPEVEDDVTNFLYRLYYELRNLGLSPQDRARNFAATNAYQAHEIFKRAVERGRMLDQIDVQKSPICRQDSDCWDVILTFFDPENDRAARDIHRFTVDVSDVIPVTVGSVRNWFVR